eukprot:XP_001698423.1 predicted protein [Chlamydomonas reinhardtii]
MDDPLRGTFGEDMEDLTAHLAHLPAGRSSHDGLDLGDNTELQGNMDRFRALASLGDDGADDLFTPGFGGLGLGGSSATTATTATANYPTYGELAAAGKPPSYEDSIMYDQAPLGLLAPAARYRGYFVPPRPEKNALKQSGQLMHDSERAGTALVRASRIGRKELRLFLSAEGDLDACAAWSALRPLGHGGGVLDGTARFSKQILGLDRAAAQPTKKSTDFMRAIKETARSMQARDCELDYDQRAGIRALGVLGQRCSAPRARRIQCIWVPLGADLEARRRAIGDLEAAGAKVLGGDAAKAKKVAELSGDVSVLEQSIAAARSQYDKIKDVNRQEMSRLQCELRGDLLAMAQHYGAVMEAAARRDTEIWLQAGLQRPSFVVSCVCAWLLVLRRRLLSCHRGALPVPPSCPFQ